MRRIRGRQDDGGTVQHKAGYGVRLLIVTQYFPPETGAPQARLYELAVRLRRRGHEVSVLTAMPNYPTGRIFDGYRRRPRRTESMDGLRVVRTWVYPSKSRRTLPRLASYASFALSAVVLGLPGIGRQDVILVESPPLFLAPTALLLGRLLRAPVVVNVSDIWPESLVQLGLLGTGGAHRAMLALERFAYRRAAAVAVTNPGAVERIQERFPDVPTTVISNGVDRSLFRPELRDEAVRRELGARPDDFLIAYCGLHGLAQGLDVVLEAADRLRDRQEIRFVMVGDGPVRAELVAKATSLGLTSVRFLGRRPKSDIPAILASADASVVPLAARMPGTMPSKVYEALASGLPVLVTRGSEAQQLVENDGVGRVFEPLDADELARAILDLANGNDRDGTRRRALRSSERFDRDRIARHTEATLAAVAAGEALPALPTP